jgi:hypothetical protein
LASQWLMRMAAFGPAVNFLYLYLAVIDNKM